MHPFTLHFRRGLASCSASGVNEKKVRAKYVRCMCTFVRRQQAQVVQCVLLVRFQNHRWRRFCGLTSSSANRRIKRGRIELIVDQLISQTAEKLGKGWCFNTSSCPQVECKVGIRDAHLQGFEQLHNNKKNNAQFYTLTPRTVEKTLLLQLWVAQDFSRPKLPCLK